jgi:hypothetical protein
MSADKDDVIDINNSCRCFLLPFIGEIGDYPISGQTMFFNHDNPLIP